MCCQLVRASWKHKVNFVNCDFLSKYLNCIAHSALQAHCSRLAKKQGLPSLHGQVCLQLAELLELAKDREEKWTKKAMADETKAYHGSLMGEEKSKEAWERIDVDKTVLKELIAMQLPCAELQELYRKLEELRRQIQ